MAQLLARTILWLRRLRRVSKILLPIPMEWREKILKQRKKVFYVRQNEKVSFFCAAIKLKVSGESRPDKEKDVKTHRKKNKEKNSCGIKVFFLF